MPPPSNPVFSNILFEGHAIVSVDGMIADGRGEMAALHNDTDSTHFQVALDRASLVVLGRLGHRRHPNNGRRRLVLTRSVSGLVPDADDANAHLWNPATFALDAVMVRLDITRGTVAVTGGTGVFDYFLPVMGHFALAEHQALVVPGGTACFSAGHPRSVLAKAGLTPGQPHMIDPAAGVTLTHWRRH